MGHWDDPQLQQTLQSSGSAWEGYKRTREGMMCAAFSRGPAAQPSQPALAALGALGALGVLVALAAAAPAAAAGVAVAEPAGSLLPAVGSGARHLGTADVTTWSTALHPWEVDLPQPLGTSQVAQPDHWAARLHLEDLWLASPPRNVCFEAPDGSPAVRRLHLTIVPRPS